jgi:hypothetical protein
MMFIYNLENNGVDVPLLCFVSYDYSTDRGPEACLDRVYMTECADECPNLINILKKEDKEEIEQAYLDNVYAIEQSNTALSLTRDDLI